MPITEAIRQAALAFDGPCELRGGGYIAPRGWDAERLRAYLAGRQAVA